MYELRLLAALAVVAPCACGRTLPEPDPSQDQPPPAEKATPPAARASAPTPAPAPVPSRPPMTRAIVEGDHLHRLDLVVGDIVEAPADDAFDWSMHAQGGDVFTPVLTEGDGAARRPGAPPPPPARVRYRVAKSGGTHLIVDGDPKCLKVDAACGTSKREWTIFVVVP